MSAPVILALPGRRMMAAPQALFCKGWGTYLPRGCSVAIGVQNSFNPGSLSLNSCPRGNLSSPSRAGSGSAFQPNLLLVGRDRSHARHSPRERGDRPTLGSKRGAWAVVEYGRPARCGGLGFCCVATTQSPILTKSFIRQLAPWFGTDTGDRSSCCPGRRNPGRRLASEGGRREKSRTRGLSEPA